MISRYFFLYNSIRETALRMHCGVYGIVWPVVEKPGDRPICVLHT